MPEEQAYSGVARSIVRFLGIDTTPLKANTRYQKAVNLDAGEYVYARVENIAKYRRNLKSFPHLSPWVNGAILTSDVNMGAGQVRSRGRLAFTVNYPTIRTRLGECMEQITSDESWNQTTGNGIAVQEGIISVYIVCSLLGGTGSGSFLDLAYAARHELQQSAGGHDVQVIGILVLPPASGKDIRVYSANAYAALLELNYFNDPATEYRAQFEEDAPLIRSSDSPFSYCYLLDVRNETGAGIGEDKLVEMLGHYIFLDLSHEFAARKNENRDNHKQWLGADDYDCPTKYLSFGLSAAVFPKDQVLAVCANRLAKEIVSGWIDPVSSPDDRELQEDADRRLVQANWDRDRVRSGLAAEGQEKFGKTARDAVSEIVRKAEQAAARALNESAIRALEKMAQTELPSWVSGGDLSEPDVTKRREVGAFPEQIRHGLNSRIENMRRWLDGLVPELVNDARYRHQGCRGVLARIEDLARSFRDELYRDSAELKTRTEDLYQDLSRRLGQVRTVIRKAAAAAESEEGNGRRRRRRDEPSPAAQAADAARKAITGFCRAAAQYSHTRIESFTCDCALKFYEEMLEHLRKVGQELSRYEDSLVQLREEFASEERRFLQSQPAVNGLVLYSGDPDRAALDAIDGYYSAVGAEKVRELDEELQGALGIADMGLYEFFMTKFSSTEVTRSVRARTTAEFRANLDNVHVLDLYFQQFAGEQKAENQLAQLYRLSAPFVYARAGGVPGFTDDPEMRQINVGAPNAITPRTPNERRFKEMATKVSSVPDQAWVHVSGNSDVLFLQERAGFPLRLMEDALERCQAHYETLTSEAVRREPVHAREDIEEWGSLIPPAPELKQRAWCAFLTAVAAGAVEFDEQRNAYEISYVDDVGVQHTTTLAQGLPPLHELEYETRPYPNGVMALLLKLCDREGPSPLFTAVEKRLEQVRTDLGDETVRQRLLHFVNEELPEDSEFTARAKTIIADYLRRMQAEPAAVAEEAEAETPAPTAPVADARPAAAAGEAKCTCGEAVTREMKICPVCGRGLWECPACGRQAKPHWLKCPSCMHDLTAAVEAAPAQRQCPTCGEPLEPDMKICPVCG